MLIEGVASLPKKIRRFVRVSAPPLLNSSYAPGFLRTNGRTGQRITTTATTRLLSCLPFAGQLIVMTLARKAEVVAKTPVAGRTILEQRNQ